MELGMEAGAEIEQTLAFARQTTERQLATYRVWMFGFLCLVSYPISYFNGDYRSLEGLRSPAVLTLLAVYALLLRARVLRREVTDRVVWLSIVGDLLGVATAFWVAVPSEQSRFIETHVAAPTFICILAVNLLRNDGRAAILAGGVTALVLPVVLFRQEPFNFLPIALALGCIPMSIIGVAAARQSRRTLDTFARLRLLRRYLAPQAVARVLRDNPEAAFSLGGRLLTVTLLSADLRDFTALAEKLTPDEVVRQLNAYHGAMLKVVRRHGGMLDKFIGDGPWWCLACQRKKALQVPPTKVQPPPWLVREKCCGPWRCTTPSGPNCSTPRCEWGLGCTPGRWSLATSERRASGSSSPSSVTP